MKEIDLMTDRNIDRNEERRKSNIKKDHKAIAKGKAVTFKKEKVMTDDEAFKEIDEDMEKQ